MDLKTYLEITNTSQQALADRLTKAGHPVTQGAISQWLDRGRVPAERVLQLERVSDGVMARHDLRPDLYPIEGSAA